MQHRDEVRGHGDPCFEPRPRIGKAPVLQEHRHVDIALAVAAPFRVTAEKPGG